MKIDLNQRMMFRIRWDIIIKGYLMATRSIFNIALTANQLKRISFLYACPLFKSWNLYIDFNGKENNQIILKLGKTS
jgi:hypothetical protein